MTSPFRFVVIFFIFSSLFFRVFSNDINTGGHRGIIRTLSAETLGKTGFNFGGAAKYGTEMEYVAGPRGRGEVLNSADGKPVSGRTAPHLVSGNIFAAYGVTSFWDFAVDLPLYYDRPGWNYEYRTGIGDLELTTKMAYPFGRDDAWLTNAYYLKVLLPTGSSNRGFFPRHVYYLTKSTLNDTDAVFALKNVYFNPQIIWSADFGRLNGKMPFLLHANLGGVIATRKSNSAVVAAVGLEFRPHPVITLFTEISGESRVKWYTDFFSVKSFIYDPFWLTPGVRFNRPNGLYFSLAGDIGISNPDSKYRTDFVREGYAYSTKALPRYNVQFTLGWQGIGIKPDRDRDGIPDRDDKCPNDAEHKDGFEDDDGCPEFDNDGDGIPDSLDKCPNEPEHKDGFEDNDGCPEFDNDGDGIPDSLDKCPNEPEHKDGFEDNDGCPDLDNDGDGVADTDDKCPNMKGVPENNGCPKTEEIKRGRLILEGVNFQSGKAILTQASYAILDRVYESLVEWENVKLEIQGHTDNVGSDEVNLKISQARADAVMQYLIQRGISPSRLKAVGYGKSSPIADNRTAEGRAINRRVELRRID